MSDLSRYIKNRKERDPDFKALIEANESEFGPLLQQLQAEGKVLSLEQVIKALGLVAADLEDDITSDS